MNIYCRRLVVATLATGVILTAWAGPSGAHPHTVDGRPIANSQNHAPFNESGDSCGGDPAAYGLETAHHGPDQGQPGRSDGCYRTTVRQSGTIWVPDTDANPAID